MLAKRWAQYTLPSRRTWCAWLFCLSTQAPSSGSHALSACVQDHILKPGNLESGSGHRDPSWVCHRELWCANISCKRQTRQVTFWMPLYEDEMLQIWATYWQWGQTSNRAPYIGSWPAVSKDGLGYAARAQHRYMAMWKYTEDPHVGSNLAQTVSWSENHHHSQ